MTMKERKVARQGYEINKAIKEREGSVMASPIEDETLGKQIITLLGIQKATPMPDDNWAAVRYNTSVGTKTAMGIGATVRDMIDNPERH